MPITTNETVTHVRTIRFTEFTKPAVHLAGTSVRFIFAAIFLVVDLNYFFSFMAMPEMSASGAAFIGSLMDTGYMLPLIKITEIVAALLLLFNFFTPLALVILAPVTVNIFLFHAVLDPGGIALAVALALMHGFLFYCYRAHFRTLLIPKPHMSV